MSLNKFMHPRNKYKNKKPDFKELASKYPEFEEHTTSDSNGKVHLDFKDPKALRVLTKTLLEHDFQLKVDLPPDRLVPTIPLRLNYIHWIEDILGKTEAGVKGIDVGKSYVCLSCFQICMGLSEKMYLFHLHKITCHCNLISIQ